MISKRGELSLYPIYSMSLNLSSISISRIVISWPLKLPYSCFSLSVYDRYPKLCFVRLEAESM